MRESELRRISGLKAVEIVSVTHIPDSGVSMINPNPPPTATPPASPRYVQHKSVDSLPDANKGKEKELWGDSEYTEDDEIEGEKELERSRSGALMATLTELWAYCEREQFLPYFSHWFKLNFVYQTTSLGTLLIAPLLEESIAHIPYAGPVLKLAIIFLESRAHFQMGSLKFYSPTILMHLAATALPFRYGLGLHILWNTAALFDKLITTAQVNSVPPISSGNVSSALQSVFPSVRVRYVKWWEHPLYLEFRSIFYALKRKSLAQWHPFSVWVFVLQPFSFEAISRVSWARGVICAVEMYAMYSRLHSVEGMVLVPFFEWFLQNQTYYRAVFFRVGVSLILSYLR
jgi:hypothetical protein